MKKIVSLILSLALLFSLGTGVLAATDKFDPAKEVQKQLDQGIAKGEEIAKDKVSAEVDKQLKSVEARVENVVKANLPKSGSNVLYIVLAILAIGVVLSIFKRLIKLAVFIIVLGLIIMWAKPMLLPLLNSVKF